MVKYFTTYDYFWVSGASSICFRPSASGSAAAAESAASRAPLSAASSSHSLACPPFLSEGRFMAATPSVIAAHARALQAVGAAVLAVVLRHAIHHLDHTCGNFRVDPWQGVDWVGRGWTGSRQGMDRVWQGVDWDWSY
jgi:hypothetical protein